MSKLPEEGLLETGRLAELGMLTAGLIHELRQPLFAVKAFTEMIRREPESAGVLAGQVLEQVQTMERLLEGYGDFSRRPNGTQSCFDVRVPLQSARAILEQRAYSAGVTLNMDVPPLPFVVGSALALQQAIVNLGANAIDAAKSVENGSVSISAHQDGDVLVMDVRDNGPGFPENIRRDLFSGVSNDQNRGTGLGLVLTRQLVDSLGGELRLKEGEGTCWELRIPSGDPQSPL